MAPAAALVFAGKSVAAPVIKEIISKAFSYLGGYYSAESMEEMRNKLDRGMPKIQAVLDVVSPDQIEDKSKALDDWFWQLRGAVEEAEDAVDEIEYHELEEKALDAKVSDQGSSLAKMKHKVVRSVKRVSILDKTVKQFTHHSTLKRLKKAMEGLDKAAADITSILTVTKCLKGTTSGNQRHEDLTKNCRETGSMLSATKLVGREAENKRIIEWLTKTTPDEEAEIVTTTDRIPILSIVGHGGMGKTTLAQSICKHDEIVKDFKILWVTVSASFDAVSVISKILESATRTTPSAKHLEALQKILEEELMSVMFLLVLDDVWEEEKINEWEKLFAPLRSGKSGSKVLLTTRMASVADVAANVMGVGRNCLTLKGLKQDESLELFNHHVFSGLNSQDYGHLKLTGEQTARKLGGCPLVIKVASGHLKSNMTSEYWNSFLDKGLEHFKGTKDDIMSVLRLSYYYLPTDLQICLRYCSLFPKGYKFEKRRLVQLWMGSGLIRQATIDSLTFEDIGEQCLVSLTRKSFFDLRSVVYTYAGRKEEYYVMHDLIHDLARNVSSGECARITDPARFEDQNNTVRHLCIANVLSFSVDEIKKISYFQNLRTIIIDDSAEVGRDLAGAFAKIVESSKSLRLFDSKLRNTSHIAYKFGNLKHLRYIYLHQISPDGIGGVVKHYHLMLLRCHNGLQRETNQVRYLGNLERLRYLGLKLPVWIENMSVKNLVSLELESCINWEHLPSLRELVWLKHLKLDNLPKLKQIGQSSHMSSSSSMVVLLPPSLDSLLVSRCQELCELPILPPSLVSLQIDNVGLTKLPKIGKIFSESIKNKPPQLLDISVTNCSCLTSLEGSLLEQKMYMGTLRALKMKNCINLESASIAFEEMSELARLNISNCPKLRTIRNAEDKFLSSSLGALTMGQCGDLEHPLLGSLQRLTNLTWLMLMNCSRVVSLPSAEVFNTSLKSLRSMCLWECENLSSLGGLGSLPSPHTLKIYKCSKLVEAVLSPTLDVSRGEEQHLVDSGTSLRIRCLEIDHPSLLLVEPLKSLCHTQHLEIGDGSEKEILPERWLLQNRASLLTLRIYKAKSLESLPPSIRDLSSLNYLRVGGADQLQSLPDLPSSVQYLDVYVCNSELEKKSREHGSPERNKISHIPRVIIGRSYFIMGKECSQETFERLCGSDYDTLTSWANQQKDDRRVGSSLGWWKKQCCLKNAS